MARGTTCDARAEALSRVATAGWIVPRAVLTLMVVPRGAATGFTASGANLPRAR